MVIAYSYIMGINLAAKHLDCVVMVDDLVIDFTFYCPHLETNPSWHLLCDIAIVFYIIRCLKCVQYK
jgi:hypothetical protein